MHSSWVDKYSVDELREFLDPVGHRLVGGVDPGPKAGSILLFLQSRPDVQDWLVIDDEAGEFPAVFLGRVVICDRSQGISDAAVQNQIRSWLTMPAKEADSQLR